VSTATEDFLLGMLGMQSNLQILKSMMCDSAKFKVLHGSDMDILWLQRVLGLYVFNMFDTGQDAHLLQYLRFSLAD
jgi:exosome complex exonuclease RRP6